MSLTHGTVSHGRWNQTVRETSLFSDTLMMTGIDGLHDKIIITEIYDYMSGKG